MSAIKTTWFLFGRQAYIPEEYSVSTHFEFYRFYCIFDGECIYEDENGAVTLEKGHVYLLPRKSYSLRYGSHNKFLHVWGHFQIEGWQFNNVIKFDLKNDPVHNDFVSLIDDLSKKYFVASNAPEARNMTSIFSDDDYFTVVESVFSSFVSYLYLNTVGREEQVNPLKAILAYINNNLSSDLSNDTLARITQYSRTHFIQEFTRLYRIPPQTYVVKARISQAIVLLMNDEKIYNISYKVGYDNPKSFARAFKRETGLSPQDYKSLHYLTIHKK